MDIIVACFGNVLRGDDGFGLAVARHLTAGDVPVGVRVMEVGIGGIHLLQELLDPVDALIVVDAVDVGRPPGTVVVLDPEITDVRTLGVSERRDALADMHLANPDRVFTLARGLDVLPDVTVMVGCQPADAQRYGEGLTPEVQRGVAPAAAEVQQIVQGLGISWD